MTSKLSKLMRRWVVKLFPRRFPGLYSTLDDPIIVPVQEAAYQLGVDVYIKPDDRIMDVGFGLGYGMAMMAQNGCYIVGIDIDHKAVRRARLLNFEELGIQEINHYDGMYIPYPDEVFDVVTCIDVIEHVPDYQNLLEEMVRVSRRVV